MQQTLSTLFFNAFTALQRKATLKTGGFKKAIKVRTLFTLSGLLFLMGCALPSQVLKVQESVSRETITLSLAQNPRPFFIRDRVGGEHVRTYRLLGFAGEEYQVEVLSDDEGFYCSVRGDGFTRYVTQKTHQRRIYSLRVTASATFISVAVSAHPIAQYQLKITRTSASDS